jgi:hypothetical protein
MFLQYLHNIALQFSTLQHCCNVLYCMGIGFALIFVRIFFVPSMPWSLNCDKGTYYSHISKLNPDVKELFHKIVFLGIELIESDSLNAHIRASFTMKELMNWLNEQRFLAL